MQSGSIVDCHYTLFLGRAAWVATANNDMCFPPRLEFFGLLYELGAAVWASEIMG